MRQYLDIVQRVLDEGKWKSPVRKNDGGEFIPVDGGVKTLAVANVHFSHDMDKGFPLLTTKKMAFKTMCVELEGFLKGITTKKWYQERKCKIWNEWANPQVVEQLYSSARNVNPLWEEDPKKTKTRKEIQVTEDDLGPIYGYQWRRFGEVYDEDDGGVLKGYDQLTNVLDTLKKNPHDRRMVVSAWNPNQLSRQALPPCHLIWVVTVINGELNLHWTQRSCDLMLGVTFNIASYGLLLESLAEYAGLAPGNLSGILCDCHIYENQIDAAKEQVLRAPKTLPIVHLPLGERSPIEWTYQDIELLGYDPHKKLDFGAVAV